MNPTIKNKYGTLYKNYLNMCKNLNNQLNRTDETSSESKLPVS